MMKIQSDYRAIKNPRISGESPKDPACIDRIQATFASALRARSSGIGVSNFAKDVDEITVKMCALVVSQFPVA
jgi:hypothetical protein